jgi:hypothetical protein
MPHIGGKDSKRHFTVVMGNKEHGLYVSSSPSSAAKKAVTKLCTANKGKQVDFYIREITQGSKKKTYGPYLGHIEKLKEPIELKGRVIKYKPVAKLSGKVSIKKGGMKDGEDPLSQNHKSSVVNASSLTVLDQSLKQTQQNKSKEVNASQKQKIYTFNDISGVASNNVDGLKKNAEEKRAKAEEKRAEAKKLRNIATQAEVNAITARNKAKKNKNIANQLKTKANAAKSKAVISANALKALQSKINPGANSAVNGINTIRAANTSSTIRANTSANGNNAGRAAIPTANSRTATAAYGNANPTVNGNNARKTANRLSNIGGKNNPFNLNAAAFVPPSSTKKTKSKKKRYWKQGELVNIWS